MAPSSTAPGIGFPSVLAHAFFLQAAVYLVRPATSYKALELGVDPGLLGLVVASFSILPVFLAVFIGRAADRGKEKHILLAGAALLIIAGAGLLFAAPSLPALLGWNLILGVGHLMSLIGEHSRLASATNRNMDRVFGFYTMVTAVAQAVAPLLLGVLGGPAVTPDTSMLLLAYLVGAAGVLATSVLMARHRGAGRSSGPAKAQVKLRTALHVPPAARNTLIASIGLSMMVLCTIDLLQVYLPALAVERGISTQAVGVLLALRAVATVLSRLAMDRLVRAVGRARLLLVSTGASAVLVALLMLPLPTSAMAVLLVLAGLGLGIGQPLSMTVVSMTATEGTRGTWMSIRLLGNRLGQAVIPVGVGVFATSMGAGGVFLALGVTTAAATLGAIVPLRSMED
ncbi:MFS transporter [Paeniglutamicibacter sp. ABSL32-1]|uniref:MFS transporter n=1 Tax=Paeniglutamicibacter quisquiliarum TaxID=2849498 RepID=UPI001C2DAC0C|nr:MFS transporter [Paeniglutamicibacter quisquiliarum]MBV1778119.1 MFS transporter [Paeniglutamicibacter quisquiliarum]